jgi:SAM-dependent methyltransferase
MASRHTLFRVFYRIGFTPWDGHPLARSLRVLIEGTNDASALPAASALELGCGTGDCSIYLAKHGWKVTAIDFVPKALAKARAKADAAAAPVAFVHADVTQLSRAGIGSDFNLIVDNGCLHNMSDGDRDARRAAVDRRVPSRRAVRCARRRQHRNGTAIRPRLDGGVRRRRTGAGPRTDPDAVLPLSASQHLIGCVRERESP